MKLVWRSRTRTAGPWRLKLERTEITAEEAHLGLRGTAVFELGPAVTEDCRLSLRRIAMGRKKVRRERERALKEAFTCSMDSPRIPIRLPEEYIDGKRQKGSNEILPSIERLIVNKRSNRAQWGLCGYQFKVIILLKFYFFFFKMHF